MTPNEFRELALSMEGVAEGAHMGHADFRAHGRVFATLGYPDDAYGMVKLPALEQKRFIEMQPEVFAPARGAWGLKGSTIVQLALLKPEVARHALALAWQESNVDARKKKAGMKAVAKRPAKKIRS